MRRKVDEIDGLVVLMACFVVRPIGLRRGVGIYGAAAKLAKDVKPFPPLNRVPYRRMEQKHVLVISLLFIHAGPGHTKASSKFNEENTSVTKYASQITKIKLPNSKFEACCFT